MERDETYVPKEEDLVIEQGNNVFVIRDEKKEFYDYIDKINELGDEVKYHRSRISKLEHARKPKDMREDKVSRQDWGDASTCPV